MASQRTLERKVALKLLTGARVSEPGFMERFRADARSYGAINHPHLVALYAVGECDDGPFVAMRLVPGRTLAALVEAHEVDAQQAVRWAGQLAGAVDALHASGLVHGRIAPKRALVDDRGEHAHLAGFDFGSLHAATAAPYAAPEVRAGEPPTPAADRYSLAMTLRDCLGRDAGARVAAALAPALSPDPRARPATAGEIVLAAAAALPAPVATPARHRPRWPLVAGAGLLLAGIAAVVAGVPWDERATSDPPPPVAAGERSLGSELLVDDARRVDCEGNPPSGSSPACTIVQMALPGRPLVAPADGAVRHWAVRFARGEMALQVVRRERGGRFIQAGRSQYEVVSDDRTHVFATDLELRRGDRVGLELAPGAAVGIRNRPGATTGRWTDVLRRRPRPVTRGAATGLDHEILLRTDYVPGASRRLPPQLTGAAAARAPRARQLAVLNLDLEGRAARLVLGNVDQRIVIDLFRGRRRVARLDVPDADPRGELVRFVQSTAVGPDQLFEWRNPGERRTIQHDYHVSASRIEQLN